MHRQIKHCNRIIEGLSAKEAIPKGSHSRKTSAQQVECLCEKRKEKKKEKKRKKKRKEKRKENQTKVIQI